MHLRRVMQISHTGSSRTSWGLPGWNATPLTGRAPPVGGDRQSRGRGHWCTGAGHGWQWRHPLCSGTTQNILDCGQTGLLREWHTATPGTSPVGAAGEEEGVAWRAVVYCPGGRGAIGAWGRSRRAGGRSGARQ